MAAVKLGESLDRPLPADAASSSRRGDFKGWLSAMAQLESESFRFITGTLLLGLALGVAVERALKIPRADVSASRGVPVQASRVASGKRGTELEEDGSSFLLEVGASIPLRNTGSALQAAEREVNSPCAEVFTSRGVPACPGIGLGVRTDREANGKRVTELADRSDINVKELVASPTSAPLPDVGSLPVEFDRELGAPALSGENFAGVGVRARRAARGTVLEDGSDFSVMIPDLSDMRSLPEEASVVSMTCGNSGHGNL